MLKLLGLTVIAKANGGLLPTHQAPVGGDVCPLRVCSEAEDRRRRTATLSALAVHTAELHMRTCGLAALGSSALPSGRGAQPPSRAL